METKEYLEQVYDSLAEHRINALNQCGKSDLDPPDYKKRVEEWYESLLSWVNNNPPEYYVKSINIYKNNSQEIKKIFYEYYDRICNCGRASLNLFWI